MSFPLEAYDRVVASPEDFRLAVRVPFSGFNEFSSFPVALTSPQGDEKPLVFLALNTTGRFPYGEMIELALVRVLYSPSMGTVTAITGVYSGLETVKAKLSEERIKAMGYNPEMASEAHFDEIKIATLLEGKPLILCAQARERRPYFDRRFQGSLDELPWGEAVFDLAWGDLTAGRLGSVGEVSTYVSLPVMVNELYSFYNPYSAREEALTLVWLMHSFKPVFEAVLGRLDQEVYIVEARYLPFDFKDQVKARRYRWSPERRVWYRECSSENLLNTEIKFLSELYDPDQSKINVVNFTVTPFKAFKAQ